MWYIIIAMDNSISMAIQNLFQYFKDTKEWFEDSEDEK